MSISDTRQAQKFASIAEVAAAETKLLLADAEKAPEYANEARLYAEAASASATSAQQQAEIASSAASESVGAAQTSADNATSIINQQLTDQQIQFQSFLSSYGLQFIGDYEGGPYTFTARNQYIRYDETYWQVAAATNLPFSTTGTNATSWTNDLPSLTPISDDDALRSSLAESSGATLVGTSAGLTVQESVDDIKENLASIEAGTVKTADLKANIVKLVQGGFSQDALNYIAPEMFGAKGDFNPDTQSGTDDTSAFKSAINFAIVWNYKLIKCFAKNYLISSELNLGGDGYRGIEGVRIEGVSQEETNIWFNPSSYDSVLLSNRGGSGSITQKGWSKLSLKVVSAKVGQGIASVYDGCCFALTEDFNIKDFYIGTHLINSTASGQFTEFNRFYNGRWNKNTTNLLYEVNGGDNSFHGNAFINIQNQIKTGGGAGVKTLGATTPCYIYNNVMLMNFFGGSGCYAFDLTGCNTDNIWGNLTHESAMICRTNDASSVFEFKGNFSGIGSVTFDVNTESAKHFGSFVFNNMSSNATAFTNTNLSTVFPAVYNPQLADAMDNGMIAALFTHRTSSSGRGLGFNVLADSFGWLFTTTSGGNMQSATPKYRLAPDGNSFTAYSSTLLINPSDSTYGIQLSSSIAALAPRNSGALALGTAAYPFGTLRLSGWSVTANTLIPTSSAGTSSIGSSTNYPGNIYSQNAVTVVCDENYKTAIQDIPQELIDAVGKVQFKMFKLKTAVNEKGNDARFHTSIIAQDLMKCISDAGLDWHSYGMLTYESVNVQCVRNDDGILVSVSDDPRIPVGDNYEIDTIDGADLLSEPDSDGIITLTREIYMVRMDEFMAVRQMWLESKLS